MLGAWIGGGLNIVCALLTVGLQLGSGRPNLSVIIWATNALIWTVACIALLRRWENEG